MTRPAPPPTRYGAPVVQRRASAEPAGVAPPPTRFGAPIVQRRPEPAPQGVAPPPTRFAPATPFVQAKAVLLPAGVAQPMIKKTRLPKLLKQGDAGDFAISGDNFIPINPSATTTTSKVTVCNGGVSMTATVRNDSDETWTVGFLQAVESYTGKEIYQNNTVTYTFNAMPLKDASSGTSVFYDGNSQVTIRPGATEDIPFMDAPEAVTALAHATAGNLVTVERDQSFTLWLWARRNTRDSLLLKTYHWGINSSYDVQSNSFAINAPNLINSNTSLGTIKAQRSAANNRKNLKITVT